MGNSVQGPPRARGLRNGNCTACRATLRAPHSLSNRCERRRRAYGARQCSRAHIRRCGTPTGCAQVMRTRDRCGPATQFFCVSRPSQWTDAPRWVPARCPLTLRRRRSLNPIVRCRPSNHSDSGVGALLPGHNPGSDQRLIRQQIKRPMTARTSRYRTTNSNRHPSFVFHNV